MLLELYSKGVDDEETMDILKLYVGSSSQC